MKRGDGAMLLSLLLLRACCAQDNVLLSLELTVDGEAAMLVLHEGQSYVEAAQLTCVATDNAFATDNCVSGAVTLIVGQHLRKKDAESLASPGLSLVREALQDYDPAGFVGTSPLHVDIELPIQTRRTVCDDEKCWELLEEADPATNHTLQVPAWASNTTETAVEVARLLDLWRAQDLELLERRVALERTRKATPIDPRLHRASSEPPVASFDGFYPPYFVLHTESLYFDAQRLKVAGDFRPPQDGDVCISVKTLSDEEQDVDGPAENEACFAENFNAMLDGFSDAAGTHRLKVRLRRPDGSTAGEGDVSSFVAAPALKPSSILEPVSQKFIELLRNAVIGWLYMDNAGEDPGVAGPLSSGWSGHTMVGVHKLNWLQALVETLVGDQIVGDIVECGAWRGGASIFTKGLLDALEPTGTRKVHVADTFQGFPKADDAVDTDGWAYQNFGVGGGQAVKETFTRYGLWDENRVIIHEGLFNETLTQGFDAIALLRMDCDMYRSTLDALENLYDKVSPGGIVVHNNWQYTSARAAVLHFRKIRALENLPLHLIDGNAVAWIVPPT